jgi:hypothetical protein
MAKNIAVMGIYSDRATVSDAVDVLRKAGYRAADLSVLSAENQGTKDFALEKRSKALEGAATGAAGGVVVGALAGVVLSLQMVAIPGLEPLVAAGPVLAALAGAGAGAAIGWIAGMLAGLRLPEYVAKRYAGRIRRGGILLSVHCDNQDWCDRAKRTLKETGARNISSSSEATADFGTTDRPTDRAPGATTDRAQPTFESDVHEITKPS